MTEEKQPENQQEIRDDNPFGDYPPPAPKSGRGLAFLALLVSVATAGGGALVLKQLAENTEKNFSLQAKAQESALQNIASSGQVDEITLRVNNLEKQAQALNTLDSTISAAVAANQISEDQIAAIVTANSINRDAVESLIKQELASFAQGETKIDLSKEIAAVQQSEAAAKAAVQQIDEKRVLIEHALAQNNNSATPYPLLNALKMAKIAASDGNYSAAKAYLDQAGETYTLFDLNGTAYAKYQNALTELRTEYGILAAKPAPAAEIEAIIATLPKWPYKNVNAVNLLAAKEQTAPADWQDKLKDAGQNILEKTITVVKIDDAGNAWIQANDALQIIHKDNLRLNLAFARNALQLRDQAGYNLIAKELYAQIERLFDTANSDVAAALATLERLETSDDKIPDIGALIEQIEKAAKE